MYTLLMQGDTCISGPFITYATQTHLFPPPPPPPQLHLTRITQCPRAVHRLAAAQNKSKQHKGDFGASGKQRRDLRANNGTMCNFCGSVYCTGVFLLSGGGGKVMYRA